MERRIVVIGQTTRKGMRYKNKQLEHMTPQELSVAIIETKGRLEACGNLLTPVAFENYLLDIKGLWALETMGKEA